MNRFFLPIELNLARLLIISSSLLWYPLTSSGIKLHQLIIILLASIGIMSGNLIKHFIFSIQKSPFLIIFITLWFCILFTFTALYDASWSPIKIISFYLMFIVSNYGVYILIKERNESFLLKILNQSLIIFLFVFLFLTGLEVSEVFNIFYKAIINANPKIIIFGFFGNAPIFLALSEDGLDGLRHTISFYLVLVCLVNFVFYKKSKHIYLGIFLLALIFIMQSRSAWLSLALVLPFLSIRLPKIKFSILKWIGILSIILPTIILLLIQIAPLIFVRIFESGSSYTGRLARISEALNLLGQFKLTPISLQREFSSSHIFIFDSYFSGGLIGFLLALLIIFSMFFIMFPNKISLNDKIPMTSLLILPIMVRFFTAGNGLPGIGSVLLFSIAFYFRYFNNQKIV